MKKRKLLMVVGVLCLLVVLAGHARADLIGLYEFEGDFTDTSGSDTVFDGMPTSPSPSFITDTPRGTGQAVEFLNTGLNCGNVFGEGLDMTLSFWIKETSGTPTWGIPINKWDGGNTAGLFGYGILLRGGGDENHSMLFRMGSYQSYGGWGSELRTSQNAYSLDKWNHLVFTYVDATDTATAYLNGVFDAEMSGIKDRGEAGAANKLNDLVMGNLTSANFLGMLDEVAIWNNALTADEVQAVYQNGVHEMRPNPGDGETIIAANPLTLSWTNWSPVDVNSPTTVDVWFGTDPNEANPTYDMVKIVDAGEDVSSVTVDASAEGIYYWKVDSDIGEPNMIVGNLWSFTVLSDIPPSVEMITLDQITWSGGPVPLVADITNEGASATIIEWVADPADGVEITDGDTATPTVTITKSPYSMAKIVNAGFEADLLDEDGWGGSPGWTQIVRMGNWNPPDDAYDGSAVPEGVMCAWAQTSDGGLSQILAETLAADTDYSLTVEVGNSNRYDWTGYKVQLLAGGVVIAEDDNTLHPTLGTFETSTVNYSYAPEDANKVGLPLEIRLLAGSLAPGYAECNFDDVRLTADPAFPVLSGVDTVTLKVLVSDAANPTPVQASVEIDVYDDACHMARVAFDADDLADIDKNCDIDIDDLALIAATWLNDVSIDEPVVSLDQADSPLVINGEFQMYKPGTGYTVTAEFAGGYCSNVGDNVPHKGDGNFSYADGTTGNLVDIPGWEVSSDHFADLNATGIDGSVAVRCFDQWSGGSGSRLRSWAPLGHISSGSSYTLSAMINGTPGTKVLRLFADGEEVTPSSQVDPTDGSIWNEISRTYAPDALAAYVGKAITVEFGTDLPILGQTGSTAFDNVNLEAVVVDANDLPTVEAGDNMISWNDQAVTLNPTVSNNDRQIPQRELSYVWTAYPADGVTIEDGDTQTPTVTITKPVGDMASVTLSLAVTLEGAGLLVCDSMVIDVYDDVCLASLASNPELSLDLGDINADCTTNIEDFAGMAAAWLVDYSSTGPIDQPEE